jgi:hypothetical protein
MSNISHKHYGPDYGPSLMLGNVETRNLSCLYDVLRKDAWDDIGSRSSVACILIAGWEDLQY